MARKRLRTTAWIALALACITALGLEAHGPEPAAVDTAARYGFEVALTPAGPAGSFRLVAAVRDLDSGEVVAAPTVIFEAGTPGRATSQIAARSHRVMIEARVSEDLATAELVFQTIADHKSLTFARTTVTLPKG